MQSSTPFKLFALKYSPLASLSSSFNNLRCAGINPSQRTVVLKTEHKAKAGALKSLKPHSILGANYAKQSIHSIVQQAGEFLEKFVLR